MYIILCLIKANTAFPVFRLNSRFYFTMSLKFSTQMTQFEFLSTVVDRGKIFGFHNLSRSAIEHFNVLASERLIHYINTFFWRKSLKNGKSNVCIRTVRNM